MTGLSALQYFHVEREREREERIFIIMIIGQSYNIMRGGGVKATSRLNIIITSD